LACFKLFLFEISVDFSGIIQKMLSMPDFSKQTGPVMTTYCNKIQPGTRIIITFQANGPAVVDVWVVLVHWAFSDFSSGNFIYS